MEEVKQVEAKEAEVQEVAEGKEEGPKVVAEVTIKVMDNGAFEVSTGNEEQSLNPDQIEAITRSVYEQLRDARVARLAMEMFKARLG